VGDNSFGDRLSVGKHSADRFHVGGVGDLSEAQGTLALGGLLGEYVASEGFSELDLAGARLGKTLRGASSCLYLWHFYPLLEKYMA
jgi:hypothetical protein